jgi:hypothetical protein
MNYHVIKYTGTFGYIKPWTAVRDEKTFSQQFLTPSIIAGMSQKIFGLGQKERILRHRLNYARIDLQKELAHPKWRKEYEKYCSDPEKYALKELNNTEPFKELNKEKGFPERGILLHPHLYLAFGSESDAQEAYTQHLCLCRNEDIILPDPDYGIQMLSESEFEEIIGFELKFSESDNIFPVGYNRYEADYPMMYGELFIQGDPVRNQEL